MSLPPPSEKPAESPAPWNRPDFLPEAPLEGYGYLGPHGPHACTLEELRALATNGPVERVFFAWRPGVGRLEPVSALPELFDDLKRWHLAQARGILRDKLQWAAMVGAGIWLLGPKLGYPMSWLVMMWAAFFGVPVVDALFRLREWKKAAPENASETAEATRFFHWLGWRKTSKTTHVIIGALVAVFLLSNVYGMERAIAGFAMSEQGVRAGLWWQPLTCFFLHGGLIHLAFNCMALSRLGRWVEAVAEVWWVPLVLLLSTLGGSLAGYVLPPDVPSVGASGGILGLLGFLLALAKLPERHLPTAFHRQLWQWAIYIGMLGLVAYQIVDNAGHLGGLMTGALLGALANATAPAGPPPYRTGWVRYAGAVSALVLAVAGGWMAWIFWQGRP